MNFKKVSLKDISLELGVSKSLVSFVMNGKAKEMRVSDVMAEKILAKAEEMGYKANPMAQALRTGKSNTIGLIVADISNQFYSKIARSIEDEAIEHGYHVIFGSSDEDDKKSSELIQLFYEQKVDGLIISPAKGDRKTIVKLQNDGFPIVLLDRYFVDNESNVVAVNNITGSYEIMKRLVEHGNKKIGYVTHKTSSSVVRFRYQGYVEALDKFELELDRSIIREVPHSSNENEIQSAVRDLVENHDLDAIFFFNNNLAIEGGKIIRDFNKGASKTIEIGSFDSSRYLDLLDVPYVAAVQQVEELGKVAMRLLFEQINSEVQLNNKEIIKVVLIDKLLSINS